jgi:pimeloyl-ACP methyl ester carboxylesterase
MAPVGLVMTGQAGRVGEQPLGRRVTVLLIHGGLGDDIDADRFWVQPGIVGGLEALGAKVIAPNRNTTPSTWTEAANEVTALVDEPVVVIAGSNGVSVGLRLAIDRPDLVSRLVLLWPATAGDRAVDDALPATVAHLTAGDTVRGVTDDELRSMHVPVAVMATDPENQVHQHRTVDRLVELVPGAVRIAERFPEAPHPDFVPRLHHFIAVLRSHVL